MPYLRLVGWCVGAATLLMMTPVSAQTAPDSPSYNVSTIAGSGLSGIRDGSAAMAEFMKPVGIAADANGNIYVADAAAQRIRLITKDGIVRTLGGSGQPQFDNTWVLGGFKDGAASEARFNRPSGVAVGSDGSVYVADTLNHCIRVIKNGNVSTYAGSPFDTSGEDGALEKASFQRPRAIAFNAAGELFVADYPIGIRKISNGLVTTLPLLPAGADKRFLSISFAGSGKNETMYVGTANETVAYDSNLRVVSSHAVHGGGTVYGMRGSLNAEMVNHAQDLGPAFGIVAVGDRLFYGDARSHALRVLRNAVQASDQAYPLLLPDAADFGGGYRDGPLYGALFDGPMGLALLPDGAVAVADTGNRRIRRVSISTNVPPVSGATTLPVSTTATDSSDSGEIVAGEDAFSGISQSYYRIAYLGNSYAFYNTRWADSIPGLLESRLRSHWGALGFPKPPKIVSISPIRGLAGFRDYIDNILSLGVVDAVILQLNAVNIGESFPPPKSENYDFRAYARTWMTPTTEFLTEMNAELRRAGIPLVLVINPTAAHVSPLEVGVATEVTGFEDWMYLINGPPSGDTFESDMKVAVTRSGVPSIFLLSDFLAAERDADRVPLFGTTDSHYSANGRRVAANAIAKSLEQMRFWKKQYLR